MFSQQNKWKIFEVPSSKTLPPYSYLMDGINRVFFILVYDKTVDSYEELISLYIKNLRAQGLEIETSPSNVFKDLLYVKISASKEILLHYAKIYHVELTFQVHSYRPEPKLFNKKMGSDLIKHNPNSQLYKRAPNSIPGQRLTNITSAEIIQILDILLQNTQFDEQIPENGIDKLIARGVFKAAYPLHDGTSIWSEDGALTDRQLLVKFWATGKAWYKYQPIDLIEKYYGLEIAFYFAWLGFYTQMLTPVAFIGIIVFFIGFLMNNPYSEICDSSLTLCPMCHPTHCKYVDLETHCLYAKMTHFFDNIAVVVFAVIIAIWATLFMELWKRKQAKLQRRWNAVYVSSDLSVRPEYVENTSYEKISSLTGNLVIYTPASLICYRYIITFSVVLLLISCVVAAVIGVVIFRLSIFIALTKTYSGTVIKDNVGIVSTISGATLIALFIMIFSQIYKKIAVWLTHNENHRTQTDFDNAYIYKCYMLQFVNNYAAVFYIAFIKGQFYTYPGDMSLWKDYGHLHADKCGPCGCVMDLCFQLVIIMIIKNCFSNILEILCPVTKILINKYIHKQPNITDDSLSQWEKEYMLNPVDKYFLIEEYMEMGKMIKNLPLFLYLYTFLVIQLGFVTFFVAAFPLAPLLALINNIVEIRLDAFKLTKTFRRPVPKRVSGLGAWNGIIQIVTYIAIITNGFIIAFTSQIVPRTIYRFNVDYYMRGYVNTTLSVFNVGEYGVGKGLYGSLSIKECFYPGKRYPPDHPNKYQLTDAYWYEMLIRFIVVVIFEHFVLIITGILAYAIPDIPLSVKEKIAQEINEIRNK